MTVLASLAAFTDAVEAITARPALDAALRAAGELAGCPVYLLIVPDASGSLRTIGNPDMPWLDTLAPAITRLVRQTGDTAPRGFAWRDLPRGALSRPDRALLHQAHRHGLKSAITFPLAGPGAMRGSCSFATCQARLFVPEERIVLAILAASLWDAGRRLLAASGTSHPVLTPRQRECLLWAARGKTDWEIGHILGIGEDTIERHLQQARERYGVDKRSTLIVRALFDGTLSFEEALGLA